MAIVLDTNSRFKMTKLFTFLVCAALTGCSFQVSPATAKAVNIYSVHQSKIPGSIGIYFDDSVFSERKTIVPVSQSCSAHSYPVDISDSIVWSTIGTFEQLFDSAKQISQPVKPDALVSHGLSYSAVIRLDEFRPRLMCDAVCTGSAEIGVGVTIRGANGESFSTSINASKSSDGDRYGGCEDAASAMARAIERTIRDGMERMAERISNDPRLRK